MVSLCNWADTESADDCTGFFCRTAETFSADVRLRAASVDDSVKDRATALTGRLFVSMQTAEVNNFKAVFGLEHVNNFGIDTYNDGGTNGQTQYATEADPQGTELDEAYLQYQNDQVDLRIGRQYINHGEIPPRYVGTAGWRQNYQTLDAVQLQVDLSDKLSLLVNTIEKAYRVVGRDHPYRPTREFDLDGFVGRAMVGMGSNGQLEGYAYNLEFIDHPSLSTRTLGLLWENENCGKEFESFDIYCRVEYATQTGIGANPNTQDYWYASSELSTSLGILSDRLDSTQFGFVVNRLNGDGRGSFTTPLASLHGYAGWADKFLIRTPTTGLIDSQLKLTGELSGWEFTTVYHWYISPILDSVENKVNYGREIDAVMSRTFGKYTWLLKVAHYTGGDVIENLPSLSRDTTKFWASVEFEL